ncbi:Strongly-conserved Zn-finger binding protein (TFIIIA) [Kickxella alabastrina]|uniref:Strongly-conserved Zn-finger binding protein (TFIIIA) n=1 Tax=Kickxella alabastrina TaxID=61397 RepID=A0ACC1ILV5_9FUNG|nr:Strongly-conserved Zn-finger binding protein (TFIIIA) [Kickxella alabastrina]
MLDALAYRTDLDTELDPDTGAAPRAPKRHRPSPAAQPQSLRQYVESTRTQPTTPSRARSTASSRAKNYACMSCPKAFTRPCRLAEHERTHTGARPFRCLFPGCTKTYMRDTHLAVHAQTHLAEDQRKHGCPHDGCTSRFTTSQHLKRHISAIHSAGAGGPGGGQAYGCPEEGCAESFAKRNQLHAHICVAHNGADPHRCAEPGCTAAFRYPSQLRRHRITHTEAIQYRCIEDGCTEVFAKWSELQAHRRSHRRTHRCLVCQAEFARTHALNRHILTHEPDRPVFACPRDACARFYLDANSLRAHIAAVHCEEPRRYVCEREGCGKAYAYAHSLRRHVARAHLAKQQQQKQKQKSKPRPLKLPTPLEVASGMAYADPQVSGRALPCSQPGCAFRFKRTIELDVHMAAVHGVACSPVPS